jgi:hypothetical protein
MNMHILIKTKIMKKLLLLLCVLFIFSCGENEKDTDVQKLSKKIEDLEDEVEESKYKQNILNQTEKDNSVNQNTNSSNSFYVINTSATKKESLAKKGVESLISRGYEAGYLWIPEYKSLSGKEYYSVYIGPFYSQSDCEKAVEEYRKIDRKAYALLVSQENKRVEIRGVGKVKVIEPYHKENEEETRRTKQLLSFSEANRFMKSHSSGAGQYIVDKLEYEIDGLVMYLFLTESINYPGKFCVTSVGTTRKKEFKDGILAVDCSGYEKVTQFEDLKRLKQLKKNSRKVGCDHGDCKNGFGIFIWEEGDKYIFSGESENEKRNISIHSSDMVMYEGDWVNGKCEGNGRVIFPDRYKGGMWYDGEWENGKWNGWGKLQKNGIIQEGRFKNDKFILEE